MNIENIIPDVSKNNTKSIKNVNDENNLTTVLSNSLECNIQQNDNVHLESKILKNHNDIGI